MKVQYLVATVLSCSVIAPWASAGRPATACDCETVLPDFSNLSSGAESIDRSAAMDVPEILESEPASDCTSQQNCEHRCSRETEVVDCALRIPTQTEVDGNEGLADQIDTVISQLVTDNEVPGIIAAIADETGILAISAAGIRKAGNERRITESDLMRMGSCTKAMSGVMLATLVDEGKLEWETTFAEVFPELTDDVHEDFHSVTLQMLLEHTAGFRRDAPRPRAYNDLELKDQRLAIVRDSLASPSDVDQGTHHYSNLGYVTAGCMAERVTGMSWEALMTTKLFMPLGMDSAGFGMPTTSDPPKQPWGHRKEGDEWIATDYSLPFYGASGRVHCTFEDWARFAALQLPTSTPTVVDRSTLNRLKDIGWARGERQWAKGETLVQNGSNARWFATCWVAPILNRIYMVATNGCGDLSQTRQICERVIVELSEIDSRE